MQRAFTGGGGGEGDANGGGGDDAGMGGGEGGGDCDGGNLHSAGRDTSAQLTGQEATRRAIRCGVFMGATPSLHFMPYWRVAVAQFEQRQLLSE